MISLYRNEYTIYIMRMLFSLPLLSDISIFDVAMTPFYNVLCLDVFFGTPPLVTSHYYDVATPPLYNVSFLDIFFDTPPLRHLIFPPSTKLFYSSSVVPPHCDISFLMLQNPHSVTSSFYISSLMPSLLDISFFDVAMHAL